MPGQRPISKERRGDKYSDGPYQPLDTVVDPQLTADRSADLRVADLRVVKLLSHKLL